MRLQSRFVRTGSRFVLLTLLGALLLRMPVRQVDSAEMGTGSAVKHDAGRQGLFALIVVVDAARPDEFDLSKMPNLARLVAGGTTYSQAWAGQLPSITETSHATIGTGVLPNRHLILGDTWRVPGTNQMSPDLLSGVLDRTGYIGKFIHEKSVPDIASIVHHRFPGSTVVALSGHKVYAADALGAGDADYVAFGMKDKRHHYVPAAIPGHEPDQKILRSKQLDLPSYPRRGAEDEWTTTLALKFLFRYHPRLMMINLPEVDDYGHIAGTDQSVMQPLMANVDHEIGRLIAAYGRAGMLSRTDIVVTADHAMVPAAHLVQQSTIRAVLNRAGAPPLYLGHGDYCPIWLKDLAAVPRAAAALANAALPRVVAVYMKDATGRYVLMSPVSKLPNENLNSTYSDLLSTFDSGESPDIVLMYGEDTITMTPTFLKVGRRGDHGGATWGSQHIPLILAGPNIKQAYVSGYPARLVDIAPTVETLLGATPSGQDGVPLADAMIHVPPSVLSAQAHAASGMSADVRALKSGAEKQAQARHH